MAWHIRIHDKFKYIKIKQPRVHIHIYYIIYLNHNCWVIVVCALFVYTISHHDFYHPNLDTYRCVQDRCLVCFSGGDAIGIKSGPRFNIKMTSYQYRKSHCGDKTILRPSYLHNGISYTAKMTSLYWISPLVLCGGPGSLHGAIVTAKHPPLRHPHGVDG